MGSLGFVNNMLLTVDQKYSRLLKFFMRLLDQKLFDGEFSLISYGEQVEVDRLLNGPMKIRVRINMD